MLFSDDLSPKVPDAKALHEYASRIPTYKPVDYASSLESISDSQRFSVDQIQELAFLAKNMASSASEQVAALNQVVDSLNARVIIAERDFRSAKFWNVVSLALALTSLLLSLVQILRN